MNQSYIAHLRNKYPNARVSPSESGIDVIDNETNEHLLALRMNGAGQLLDASEQLGLPHRFDLSPIPRDARVHKLHKDGKLGLDEKHEERREKRSKFICPNRGCVKSMVELKRDGWEFHDNGNVSVEGSKPSEAAEPAPADGEAPAPAAKKSGGKKGRK